jgi:hypothetical protein
MIKYGEEVVKKWFIYIVSITVLMCANVYCMVSSVINR